MLNAAPLLTFGGSLAKFDRPFSREGLKERGGREKGIALFSFILYEECGRKGGFVVLFLSDGVDYVFPRFPLPRATTDASELYDTHTDSHVLPILPHYQDSRVFPIIKLLAEMVSTFYTKISRHFPHFPAECQSLFESSQPEHLSTLCWGPCV